MRKNLLKSLVAGAAILAASASANAYVMNIGGTDYTFDSIDWSSGGSAWSTDYRDAAGNAGGVGHTFNLSIQSAAAALLLGNQTVYTFDASSPFELTLFATVNETVTLDIGGLQTFNLNYGSWSVYQDGAKNANLLTGVGIADGTKVLGGTFDASSPFELTLFATVNETVTLDFGGLQTFNLNYGSWSVYQDASKNANLLTGVGIADGTKVLGGSFDSGFSGSFTASNPTSGFGSQGLPGAVDAAPSGLIDPHPAQTLAVTTLQMGSFLTAALPTGFSNGVDGGTNAAFNSSDISQLVMQVDANQRFVPEPASMALLGLGMAGMAALRRRK